MTTGKRDIEAAIKVFVHGFSTDKSRTFPYEASRVGPLWLMRDAERKNARDYRGEEWIVHDAGGHFQTINSATMRRFASMWRSMATPSSGVCAA
ncbi:hypothetical protein [Mesorhizobium sp. M0030]|uniref:hypothetical protein n=1 Tax=Mesorhizobium sp. M0030 TaxID=2956851 RepID=UPI00333572EB